MTLEDGSKRLVTTSEAKRASTTEARLANIEKTLSANAAEADDEEDGDDYELFAGNNAPRSVQIAQAEMILASEKSNRKRKAANASVFERIKDQTKIKRRSTDEELEIEFNLE
jgi:hypothetical protein